MRNDFELKDTIGKECGQDENTRDAIDSVRSVDFLLRIIHNQHKTAGGSVKESFQAPFLGQLGR